MRASTSLFALTVIAALSDASAQSQPESAVPTANLPILARQGQVSLDEIVVTPSRQEERAIDALAAVSLVSRSDLRIWAPQRIGTVVNSIPGVATQENPNDPATSINIRGLQDFGRVAVTIDGARQNFQRSGHNANGAFFLDPAFIRTIDVTRGPVANLYGSGAIGGVVSFETIDPKDILRPGERAAAEIGATGVFSRQSGWYGNVIGAARPTDWAAGLLGLSFRSLNGYRDGDGARIRDSGQDVKSALGKLVLTPGDGHELKLGGQYQRYDFSNGLGTSGSPRRDNEVATQNYTGQYSFSRPDLPWLNLKVSAYSTATDTDQTQLSGRGAALGAKRFFKIETQGVDVQNTMKFDLGAAALNLSYGADWFQDRVRTGDPVGNGDETTPSGKRSVYGGFAQAHVKYGIVDLIGALRYDSYELSGGRTSSDGQRASPKLTLGVTPLQGLQLYGTYAEGYRAPSITETLVDGLHPAPASFAFRPNPNLKPEIGKTLEAGLNLKYDDILQAGDRFRGKLAIFRNDVTNYIDGVFVNPGQRCGAPAGSCADAFFTYENVAKARLTGVEAELAYDARIWFASISGSSVRGDNRTALQPLQSIYPDKLILGAGLRFLEERLTVGGRLTLVDEQKRLPPSALTMASKAYALVDLYADYKITPDARAFVTLENVADVRYKRYRDGDYSPGFVGKIGFSTRFGT
ncbi:MAG: TonB-dependent hemoglobin/transferrin/lactoferrin family receptor [Bosea sp. (in: a-proteobacteria)]